MKEKRQAAKCVQGLQLSASTPERLRGILMAAVLIYLAGCENGNSRWTEDVRLHDGNVILVERTANLKSNPMVGGGGGSLNEGMTLRILQAAASGAPTHVWSDKYVPVVLDKDPESGEWFIIATFFHCDSWQKLGRPKLPYTEYRYRNGHWEQQALSSKLIGREANIFAGVTPGFRRHLEAEEKRKLNEDLTIGLQYKTIVNTWHHGC